MCNNIAKLIMVTPDNHNKFYTMINNGDGTFTATWGRVDVTSQSKIYPISLWYKKYNEKINKGYEDKTDLFLDEIVSTPSQEQSLSLSAPTEILSLISNLQAYADKVVKSNYKVTAKNVTYFQLDTAQKLINNLVSCNDVSQFNDILLEIYKTIPRRMNNVKNYLLPKSNTHTYPANKIWIEPEQILQNMGRYEKSMQK